jgi:tetratricopeptide (TPR) repeat protein
MATALHASATVGGRVVEETFARAGRALRIDASTFAVPTPEGWPYIAEVRWTGPAAVAVRDGAGAEHVLGTHGAVMTLDCGPVAVRLRLVQASGLARFGPPAFGVATGWFATVIAATIALASGETAAQVVYVRECTLLAAGAPHSPALAAMFERDCRDDKAGGMPDVWTADTIARLLKKDYGGEQIGRLNVETGDAKNTDSQQYYIPAGAMGPADASEGGAPEVAPTPVRTPGKDGGPKKHARADHSAPPPSTVGLPVAQQEPALVEDDGSVNADEGDGSDTDEPGDPLAEEKRGWGIQDWYDAEDAREDTREIAHVLNEARARLRIDPNDPEALTLLAYYQYLGEDFSAADATYDKYLSLYPDSAAGYNNKALIDKRRKKYKDEEQLYRMGLALLPDDPTTLNNLAVCLSHQHRFEEALGILARLETLDPGNPYTDLHRAKVHAEMGEDEVSYGFLERALDGMAKLDTLHNIEFRQDIRVDPSFAKMREQERFHALLARYYPKDATGSPD